MDFGLIKRAGLTQTEFGLLCGVNRATVSLWVTGRFNPHRYLRAKVQRALDSLDAAVSAGALPLPARISESARVTALKKALTSAKAAA